MKESPDSRALVVSRYLEDLAWLARVPPGWKVYLYSKHDAGMHTVPARVSGSMEVQRIPNICRETHTYLYHLTTRFDLLEDLTVFVQGNPFDHCPDLLNLLGTLDVHTPYRELSTRRILCDDEGMPHLAGNEIGATGTTLGQFYSLIFDCPSPPLFYCRGNALFAVTAARVLERPLEFYRRCRALMESLPFPALINPLEGHYFERLWHRIFDVRSTPRSASPIDDALPYGMNDLREEVLERVRMMVELRAECLRIGDADGAIRALLTANELFAGEPA